MAERLTLSRQLDAHAARRRLGRLGATTLEPAWMGLWAAPLGMTGKSPGAWLLGAKEMQRALLLTGAELPVQVERPDTGIQLTGATAPTPEATQRLWLWERMAAPRLWRIQALDTPPTPVWLPCWLGYRAGRTHQLTVISGLSGEVLSMLKPLVLAGLARAHGHTQAGNEKTLPAG
ncbi:hypothetical protein HW452_07565 [Halomonas aquamarina]|uniref:Uncharacterized protein n=1 Tax=Vreelandella aquamarina TaxID=77097 RepID=A0ACC5VT51_9GAMM|nr:hypothetical protein [Halomonas aquamarina]MBZ5487381.1 hypothetical protein [Halomonas aquamarina]